LAPFSGYRSSSFQGRTRGPRGGYRLLLITAILAGHAVLSLPVRAQQSKPQEYQVKAVYLLNFGKFIQWPAAAIPAPAPADDSFAICVLGRDPFGEFLDAALAGETINNRKVAPKRITNPHDSANCQIIFIAASEASHAKEILAVLEKSPILTVSDMSGFTNDGGMIQFEIKDSKVRFDVNLSAAGKVGLVFNSQLLKVAADVKGAPHNAGASPNP
jgi:hypothetical protein